MSKPGNSENERLSKSDPLKKERLSTERTYRKKSECTALLKGAG